MDAVICNSLPALAIATLLTTNAASGADDVFDGPGPGYREQAGQLRPASIRRFEGPELRSYRTERQWDWLKIELRHATETLPDLPTENVFARPFRLFEAQVPATPGDGAVIPGR